MAKTKIARGEAGSLFPTLEGSAPGRPVPALPSSARPLFLPDLVRTAAQSPQLDAPRRARAQAAVRKWIEDLHSGVLHRLNESQVEQDFNTKLLAALGYTSRGDVAAGASWSMVPKWPVPGAGIVDVALGPFHADEAGHPGRPRVMVELKGAGTDLDRKGSRTLTPVQQAWEYLTHSETAEWAIVTNYVEIRLYSRHKTRNHVHRVVLPELDDPDAFAEFYAVFCAESLLGTGAITLTAERLLRETGERQEKVSDELYQFYAERRAALLHELGHQGIDDLDQAIPAAQKLLDRILFIAFAEDRQLLPTRTLESTANLRAPGITPWSAFQALFRAIDHGDLRNGIHPYNGTLFKPDPILDDPGFRLEGGAWPQVFKTIGGYDYRHEVTVDVLGRIFERSITDIEQIKSQSLGAHEATLADRRRAPGRRKLQGVFYTDAFIVEYLVNAALGPAWDAQSARLAEQLGLGPEIPDPPPPAYTRAMLQWLDSLTVCDPACGSGAFLVAAYDWFENARLGLLSDLKATEPDAPECAGDREDWQARSAPVILQHNLYGVDLSPESVEIAQLSLWIRTARRGQPLTDLSRNILVGNSVVDDPEVDLRAFDWQKQFPHVFEKGGFDAVIGNPPYVRQEHLSPLKPYLEKTYRAYHGMADLYVYFYERGLRILKPGGRLAFVVTNKWMKAGYGEPLRRYFAEHTWIESVVDFGHAKQFFKDADVFPCFLVARRPTEEPQPETVRVCVIPREQVRIDDLREQVATEGIEVERDRLNSDAWQLEPKAVSNLIAKIRERGVPLAEFAGVKPYYGIKTGLNEAFLINTPTRDALVDADPKSASIIKPYLRGQDIKRWSPEWARLWMIFTRRGIDIDAYPAIKQHLQRFRDRLEPKPSDWAGRNWPGRKPGTYKWYEIQDPIEYWELFDKAKIVYQEIQFHPSYSLDTTGLYGNNKTFFLPSEDLYMLSVLNSPLLWWHNWRFLPRMKDEALSPAGFLMEMLPIAQPTDAIRAETETAARRLIEITKAQQATRRDVLDWLQVEYEVSAPGTRLQNLLELDSDAFVAEVQKRRGKTRSLSVAALRHLRDEYARTVAPARTLSAEALTLEQRLSDLVNAAYGLTPEDIALMWSTSPPRMPLPRLGPAS